MSLHSYGCYLDTGFYFVDISRPYCYFASCRRKFSVQDLPSFARTHVEPLSINLSIVTVSVEFY